MTRACSNSCTVPLGAWLIAYQKPFLDRRRPTIFVVHRARRVWQNCSAMTGIRGHFSVSLAKFFDHTGTESSTFSPGKISDVIITCPIIKIVTKQDDKLLRSQGEVSSHAFFSGEIGQSPIRATASPPLSCHRTWAAKMREYPLVKTKTPDTSASLKEDWCVVY